MVPGTTRSPSCNVVDHLGADPATTCCPVSSPASERELRLDAVAIDVGARWMGACCGDRPADEVPASRRAASRGDVVGRLVVGWEDGPSLRERDEEVLGSWPAA